MEFRSMVVMEQEGLLVAGVAAISAAVAMAEQGNIVGAGVAGLIGMGVLAVRGYFKQNGRWNPEVPKKR